MVSGERSFSLPIRITSREDQLRFVSSQNEDAALVPRKYSHTEPISKTASSTQVSEMIHLVPERGVTKQQQRFSLHE